MFYRVGNGRKDVRAMRSRMGKPAYDILLFEFVALILAVIPDLAVRETRDRFHGTSL